MSPLWRDQVRLLLTPEYVCYERRMRGLRPRVVDRRVVRFDAGEPRAGAPTGQAQWERAVGALAELLREAAPAGADAKVVLSGHFVRHCLLPPSDLLATDADYLGFARHGFAHIHGPEAETWNLRVSVENDDRACVASAVDEALVGALRHTLAAARLRPASLQPLLMSVYNGVRNRIGDSPGRLLIVEPGCALLARLDAGWQRLRSQRTGVDWIGDITRLLERERVLDDRAPGKERIWLVPLLLDIESLPRIPGGETTLLVSDYAAFAPPPAAAPLAAKEAA